MMRCFSLENASCGPQRPTTRHEPVRRALGTLPASVGSLISRIVPHLVPRPIQSMCTASRWGGLQM